MMSPNEIRACRDALAMNKTQFCKLLGIARTTLDRWESGRNIPMQVYEKQIRRMLYAKQITGQTA